MHTIQDVIHLFNETFQQTWRTQLIGGAEEPLYHPAENAADFHRIYFTKDYFSSALHECAHWFIAGKDRRLQVDYGYWYEPDGRNAQQQLLFQQVEVKPQALECILSKAARYPFRISLDNLNEAVDNASAFEEAVYQQVALYEQQGLPSRAETFRQVLIQFYTKLFLTSAS